MADRALQYIIKLGVDEENLKKQMSGWNWEEIIGIKDFGKHFEKPAKEASDAIENAFKNTEIDWDKALQTDAFKSAITKVVQHANAELREGLLGKDEAKKVTEFIAEIGNAWKEVGVSMDAKGFARSMAAFAKSIEPLGGQIEKLSAAFDKVLGGSVVRDATQASGAINKISRALVTLGADKSAIANIRQLRAELEKAARTTTIELDIDYSKLEDKEIEKRLRGKLNLSVEESDYEGLLMDEWDNQIEALNNVQQKLKTLKAESTAYNLESAKLVPILNTILSLGQKLEKVTGQSWLGSIGNIGDATDVKDEIKDIVATLNEELEKSKKALQKATESLLSGLGSVDIKLNLSDSDKAQFEKSINDYITSLNKTSTINDVKIGVKVNDEGGMSDEDIEAKISKVKEWRRKVVQAVNADKEKTPLHFGIEAITESLHNDLQEYFEQNEIDIHINKEALAQEIKTALENGGVSGVSLGGGSTVAFDEKSLAMAIATGLQAFFTGDFTPVTGEKKKVADPTEPKKDKPFYLDPQNDYNRQIAEEFRSIVEYALGDKAPNKKTAGFLEHKLIGTQFWDDKKNVAHLDQLAKASTMDLIEVLRHMTDQYGQTLADDFSELIKGTGKNNLLTNFRTSLMEMLRTNNIGQISIEESERELKRSEMWEDYFPRGRLAAGLGKLRADPDKLEIPDIAEIEELAQLAKEVYGKDSEPFKKVSDAVDALKIARDDVKDVDDESQKAKFVDKVEQFKNSTQNIYTDLTKFLAEFAWGIEVKGYKNLFNLQSGFGAAKLWKAIDGDKSRIVKPHLYKGPDSVSKYVEDRPDGTDVLYRDTTVEKFKPKDNIDRRWEESDASKEAAKRSEEATSLLAKSEAKITKLTQEESEIEKQIEEKRKQKTSLENEIAQNQEAIAKANDNPRKTSGARQRLANRKATLEAVQAEKEAAEMEKRILAQTDFSERDREFEDINKKYARYDLWKNNIDTWTANPDTQGEEYSEIIEELYGYARRRAINNRDSAKENIDLTRMSISKEDQTIKRLQSNIKKFGETPEYKRDLEIAIKRRDQYKEDLKKYEAEFSSQEAEIKQIEAKILGSTDADKKALRSDLMAYLSKGEQELKEREKRLGADPRVEADIRLENAKKAEQKAQREYDKVVASEEGKKAIEIDQLKAKNQELETKITELSKDLQEAEEKKTKVAEEKNVATTSTALSLESQKVEIDALLGQAEQLNKDISQAKKDAEDIERFVKETTEAKGYKKPQYDIKHTKANQSVIDKYYAHSYRGYYLSELAADTLTESDAVPDNLTDEMSNVIESIVKSRNVLQKLSGDFGLDKFSSEEELKADIQRRLDDSTSGKRQLNPIVQEYYTKIVNEGRTAATQWLEKTLSDAQQDITTQTQKLQSFASKDSEVVKSLGSKVELATEHLKETYQKRVSAWFASIQKKVNAIDGGKLGAKEQALAIKEVEELFVLINKAIGEYTDKFKDDSYHQAVNDLKHQLSSGAIKQDEYSTRIIELKQQANKALTDELVGNNVDLMARKGKGDFSYSSFKERPIEEGIKGLEDVSGKIQNSERYVLLQTRQAELLRDIAKTAKSGGNIKEIEELEKNLTDINTELAKYQQFTQVNGNTNLSSIFADDVELSERYRQSIADIIKREQQIDLAKAKGTPATELDKQYAELDKTRTTLNDTVYEELVNKQTQLLAQIQADAKDDKSTEDAEKRLEAVNSELAKMKVTKERVKAIDISGGLYKADIVIIKRYNEALKKQIELEQKLAVIKAKGGDEEQAKKDLNSAKRAVKKIIADWDGTRGDRESSMSPRAQALAYLQETQKKYDTAIKKRYTIKSRQKTVRGQLDDVENDNSYSTSWQYKKHQRDVKNELTTEYRYSDQYQEDRAKGMETALKETFEAIKKRVQSIVEAEYKKSGKAVDDETVQAEIDKIVEQRAEGVMYRLKQTLGKDGMTIDPKQLKEGYALTSQGGWEGIRKSIEEKYMESPEYKRLLEARENMRAEALRKEIARIEEEGNNVIDLISKSTPEDYEPLRKEMGKYLTKANVGDIEKEFKIALEGVGKKTDMNKVKSKLMGIARDFGASKKEVDDLYHAITENISNLRHGKSEDALASMMRVFQTDEDFALKMARGSLIKRQQDSMMRRTTEFSGKHAQGKFYADADTETKMRNTIDKSLQEYMIKALEKFELSMSDDQFLKEAGVSKDILEVFKTSMKENVYKLVENYAESLEVQDGKINGRDIRQEVIDRLNNQLGILDEHSVNTEKDIAHIEEQRKVAMKFGGIAYSEVADAEVLREQAVLESELTLEKQRQAELAKELKRLTEEDASSAELGKVNEQLDKTTDKIKHLEMLVDNKDILMDLQHQALKDEKAAERMDLDQQKLFYESKKATAEADLKSGDEKVRKSAEQRLEKFTSILTNIDAKIAERDAKEREKNDPMNIIANKFAGAIKQALGGKGGLNVDATGLATEATLSKIYEILVGVVQAMGGKVTRNPEKDKLLAELRALEAEKAAFVGEVKSSGEIKTTSAQPKTKKTSVEYSATVNKIVDDVNAELAKVTSEELPKLIKDIFASLDGKNIGTEEDAKQRHKLYAALARYRDENIGIEGVKVSPKDKKGRHTYAALAEYLGVKGADKAYLHSKNAIQNSLATTVQPEIAPSAVAEEVKENTEQTSPVAEVKPEVAKEDANAYIAKLQEILGGVTKDTKGKENSLKAIYDKLKTPVNQKGVKPFEELRAELLKLQSGNGSIEEATNKAQEFVNVFANFGRNRFADLSKWFGKDVKADATTLLGIVKQIFEVTSNEQKVRKATRKSEEVKPAQDIANAAEREAAATAETTEERKEQKSIVSTFPKEKEDRIKELERATKGYAGPQVDFSEADIGLAKEDTLKAILNLITKIQTEGVKTTKAKTEKKPPKLTEAELIQNRVLKDEAAIRGIGGNGKMAQQYANLVKQLKDEVVRFKGLSKEEQNKTTELDNVKKLAQQISALGFNIMKEASVWDAKLTQADKVGTLDTSDSAPSVRDQMEKLAKDNTGGKQYKFLSFDGTKLIYQLTDIEGHIENVTMEWSELNNQIAITSDKSVSKLDSLAGKVESFGEKFKNAIQMGYLSDNDAVYKAFEAKVANIASQSTFEDAEKARNDALRAADEVAKKIASNKKLYTGTTEMNAAERQFNNLEASGILVDKADLEMVKNYKDAYDKIARVHNELLAKKEGVGLLDKEGQKQLREAALEAKNLGKELEKAANNSQRLKQLTEDSGSYNGKPIGDYSPLQQGVDVYDAMRAKLEELGATNIKVDRIHQTATGTIRHNNRLVSDLTVEYDELAGSLARYRKQERESLIGVPAFLNGFKKKINSIMQYLAMTMSIHRVIAELRRGIQYVKEIDLALTELKKVTDETEETYDEFLKTAAKTGARLGSTISAVTEATATFAKLGYSMEQATEMAEAAIVYKNVGDNIASTEDAADSIISTMKGFGLEASESMAIVDRFNEVKFLPPYTAMYMIKMAISEKF